MDKAKKKTIKRIVSWVALAALVATLAVMPLLARQEEEADGPVASILEATVQTGQISTVLKGGGTLSAGKAMEVNLPSGVKVKEFLVKNGEAVTEGTPVAIVDRVSVMNAIVAVEDTLEYLQKEIGKAKDDTVSGTIKANAGGLVKQVFARKGDSVQDVMLTYGALAVLSLDGRMAVALEQAEALAAGDSVSVTLADGTEVDGRVESNLNGRLIITIEDDKYEVGQKVTVDTAEGDRLGTGELYVHNAWRATAYSGTVNTVYAKENAEVYEGATLLTLKDTDFEGTMQKLANLHREYEELLQDLFVMYDTEVLTAPCDGMVSGVDEDSPHLLAAVMGEEGWFVDLLDNRTTNGAEKGWKVLLLSSVEVDPDCTGEADCEVIGRHQEECKKNACDKTVTCPANPDKHAAECKTNCKNTTGCDAVKAAHVDTCPEICKNNDQCQVTINTNHNTNCPKRCTGLFNCKAEIHVEGCFGKCTKNTSCKAHLDNHVPECPNYCDGSENCDAPIHRDGCKAIETKTYLGCVAIVTRATNTNSGNTALNLSVVNTFCEITYTNKWDFGALDIQNPTGAVPDDTLYYASGSFAPGDVVVIAYEDENNYTIVKTGFAIEIPTIDIGSLMGGMDISGLLGGMDLSALMGGLNFGNFASYGAFAGAGQATGPQLFDLKGSTLMTVTEQESMTLTIAIDEHDIAKVALGQIADVELTALKGETFQAEVTGIGNFGTNNGGSSKFNVELTMDADPRMLAGMNANAEIPLSTKMEVPVIPVAALVETVNGTVVYTGLDSKTGDLAAPVAVEIGASDGENVEIVSGVNKGDKIYYSYYDVLELDHTAKNEFSFR